MGLVNPKQTKRDCLLAQVKPMAKLVCRKQQVTARSGLESGFEEKHSTLNSGSLMHGRGQQTWNDFDSSWLLSNVDMVVVGHGRRSDIDGRIILSRVAKACCACLHGRYPVGNTLIRTSRP